jgi:cob(I)alamin adenosyltransferase
MKVYTRRGDDGETDLRGGDRVQKTDPRVEAYGSVDEVNAVVGLARPTGYDDVDEWLDAVQNHLHVLQASLATPDEDADVPRLDADDVDRIEDWIDAADEELEPLSNFIVPGGSETGARLHHARSVCRRAERRAVALAEEEGIEEHALAYLNRLSDALFTFARLVNAREGVAEHEPTY